MFPLAPFRRGAVAQLGERLLCKQEVVGSIPSGSTILFGFAILFNVRLLCGALVVCLVSYDLDGQVVVFAPLSRFASFEVWSWGGFFDRVKRVCNRRVASVSLM